VTELPENAEELKQSHVEGWGINPKNIFIHPDDCTIETDKWGAFTGYPNR